MDSFKYLPMSRFQKGFSLIEILVAFSIAAVALGIIFQIYAKGTRSSVLGKEYVQALTIAESKLAELGVSQDLNTPTLSGIENNKYRWMIYIDDYLTEQASEFETKITLKQVRIEISWDMQGKQRLITLQSLKPVFKS